MRMWLVNPAIMCRKHLLGEHVELHMLLGSIQRNKSIQGFIKNRLVEPSQIEARHDELVAEMQRRNYNHKSPMPHGMKILRYGINIIDKEKSKTDLMIRCKECRQRDEGGSK